MRIVFLSTDRKLFESGSAVRERITRFGEHFPDDEFTTIVFSTERHLLFGRNRLAQNTYAYPTASMTRALYGLDAIRVALKLPKPDVISAQDPFETGLAAWAIARIRRIPFVVEVHTDFLAPAFAAHSLLNRLRVRLAHFVLRRASGAYAVSDALRDALVSHYQLEQPFMVLPIPIHVERFSSLDTSPEQGHLLWVGRFTAEKDPISAVRVVANVVRQGHDVRLTMLGEGPCKEELQTEARRLEIADRVSFPGWTDPAPLLSKAELLLNTSKYEGYGLAIVEALAAGVPVLSNDVGIARAAGAVIVEGSYTAALSDWLSGPRERGTLKLPLYKSEEEYFSLLHSFYVKFAHPLRARVVA